MTDFQNPADDAETETETEAEAPDETETDDAETETELLPGTPDDYVGVPMSPPA